MKRSLCGGAQQGRRTLWTRELQLREVKDRERQDQGKRQFDAARNVRGNPCRVLMKALGLRTILCGLVIASIMGLAGCEELTPPKDKAPPTRMSRYRAADEEAIKARWEGMSAVGGGGSGTATVRWANAVEENTTAGIPGVTLVNPREYGGCEVFSADYRPSPSSDLLVKLAFLDCIDRTETKSGYYHVAAVCIGSYLLSGETQREASRELVVVRAGGRERDTFEVTATIAGHSEELEYQDYETNPYAGGLYEMKWAWGDDPALHALVKKLVRSMPGALDFSITSEGITDRGRSALVTSDSAAVADYTARCAGFD